MVARVARIRSNRLQIVTDGLPENLSSVAILGVALICRHRLLKPLAEALSDKRPALTARGSLSFYALIYTGYPRATYGGLGILHVYEHLSGPSFYSPGQHARFNGCRGLLFPGARGASHAQDAVMTLLHTCGISHWFMTIVLLRAVSLTAAVRLSGLGPYSAPPMAHLPLPP